MVHDTGLINVRRPRRGFTLVETLVVMGILGLLAALLVPAVQSSRATMRRVDCENKLRQLGLALHQYHGEHRSFPPGSLVMGPSFPTQTGWGWGAMILPYVDQSPLYSNIDFRLGTAMGDNLQLIATPLPLFTCPSDVGPEQILCTHATEPQYQLASGNFCGSEGILYGMSAVRIGQITDGTSNTFLLGERLVQDGSNSTLPFTSAWCGQVAFENEYDYRSVPHLMPNRVHPLNASFTDPACFGSRHAGGANFAFADGSVRFISQGIDAFLYEAHGTSDGQEVVELQP